ncbi:uncharacterized protein N7498_007679 [Penicillium cinerascens]|uniref:Uncharacterized protein n=1 Tax=Penicillium cinerascens TaxID=70096 RepID=A0A9W9MFI9_9EURO|nr:uncharacterized protein N7498_007679 [Penicillium cinerascens]KAJ5198562.1 hypothetical protein N7498_007679 [Penicillium cinerascens]
MASPVSRSVYFTLQHTGTILSATFENGKIVSQDTLSVGIYPQNWVDALLEMEVTLGCSKDVDFEFNMFNNQSPDLTTASTTPCFVTPDRAATPVDDYFSALEEPLYSKWIHPNMQMHQGNTQWLSTKKSSPMPMPTPSSVICPSGTINSHQIPGEKEHCCSHAPIAQKAPDWSSKRMTKLQNLLTAICNHPVPTISEHNGQVEGLYNGSCLPSTLHGMSSVQFAGALSRLGNVSNTLGFIYGMLSWEIFKREEERVIREENLSPVLAAKKVWVPLFRWSRLWISIPNICSQVNRQMSELLKHSGKAKDWASDGRKAAKIVFGSLEGCSKAVRSFALFLLGNVCSLDNMLKIAHFPIIRENFQMSFAQIVAERTPQWEALEANNYKVFDYAEFLRLRGPPAGS